MLGTGQARAAFIGMKGLPVAAMTSMALRPINPHGFGLKY
jgi:hypothetical protein